MPIHRTRDTAGRRLWVVGPHRWADPREERASGPEDWMQARPREIAGGLARALKLPTGGWFAVDASRRITGTPTCYWVDGRELVAWRDGQGIRFAPNRCPHMGGPLSAGRVQDHSLVCPWHGRRFDGRKEGSWQPLESFDDGVLAWVRFHPDKRHPRPILPKRPERFLDGVVRVEARCEPADVLANRLDPWHGAWLHPHSFARLRVLSAVGDVLTVRVVFRVRRGLGVGVDCTFHCADARTIVMTIVDGPGAGSTVETHATPLIPGWTAVVEATLASSPHRSFRRTLGLARLVRPAIERRARRLWWDDAAYAERTAFLRAGGRSPQRDTRWLREAPGTPRPR